MEPDPIFSRCIRHLKNLPLDSLAEWDVLAFIHEHGMSLASAERIAHLLGHSKIAVGAALNELTAKGLIHRSRNSRGVRLYQLSMAMAGDTRLAVEELMKIAKERQGRLYIVRQLRSAENGKLPGERGGIHIA